MNLIIKIPYDVLLIIKSYLTYKEITELLIVKILKPINLYSQIYISKNQWFDCIKFYTNHSKSIKKIIYDKNITDYDKRELLFFIQ
jgi:hypothetical protein